MNASLCFILVLILFSCKQINQEPIAVNRLLGGYKEIGGEIDSLKEGLWVTIRDSTGVVFSIGYYKKNMLNGVYEEYFDNGRISRREYYVDNIRQGPASYYYPNGQVHSKGDYINGLSQGVWERYAEGDTLICEYNLGILVRMMRGTLPPMPEE